MAAAIGGQWLRRLLVASAQSRSKREGGHCGPDEYFDQVVGQCSLCSDLCLPLQRGLNDDCTINCPGYMRTREDKTSSAALSLTNSKTSSSSLPEASPNEYLFVWLIVSVSAAVFVVLVIVALTLFCRKRKAGDRSPTGKDKIIDEDLDHSNMKSASLGTSKEKEEMRMNSRMEERFLPENDRNGRATRVDDDSASLCSVSDPHGP